MKQVKDVIGVITDRDIVLRGVAQDLPLQRTTLDQVMTKGVECVFEDEALAEVIAKLQPSQIRRLPVLADISEPSRPVRSGLTAASGAP